MAFSQRQPAITRDRSAGVPPSTWASAKILGFDSERDPALWLVFCGERQSPIALALAGMEGQFEAAETEVFVRQEGAGHRYVNGTVCEGATLRGVISIPSLVGYIKSRGAGKARK